MIKAFITLMAFWILPTGSIHQFKVTGINGETLDLGKVKGKYVLFGVAAFGGSIDNRDIFPFEFT